MAWLAEFGGQSDYLLHQSRGNVFDIFLGIKIQGFLIGFIYFNAFSIKN